MSFKYLNRIAVLISGNIEHLEAGTNLNMCGLLYSERDVANRRRREIINILPPLIRHAYKRK